MSHGLQSRSPLGCCLLFQVLDIGWSCSNVFCASLEAPWWDEGATTVPSAARRQLEFATSAKKVVDRFRRCVNMVSSGTATTRRSRRGTSSGVHVCPLQLVLYGSRRFRERGCPRVSQEGRLAVSIRQRQARQRGGEVGLPCALPDSGSRQQ